MHPSFALTDDGYVLLQRAATVSIPSPFPERMPFGLGRPRVRRLRAGDRIDPHPDKALLATVDVDGMPSSEELPAIAVGRFEAMLVPSAGFIAIWAKVLVAALLAAVCFVQFEVYCYGATPVAYGWNLAALNKVVVDRAKSGTEGFVDFSKAKLDSDAVGAVIRASGVRNGG